MQNESNDIVYFLIVCSLYIYFSYRVGKYGKSKGRTFSLNFIASLLFNPLLIFISLKFSKFKKVHDYLDEIKEDIIKWIILAILFLLPVSFLLMLYPATHNYNSLDIVKENIVDVDSFTYLDSNNRLLSQNITVLAFPGKMPMENLTVSLNIKELVYDKFKGFKKFQLLMLFPYGSEHQVDELKKELYKYDELKYWGFAFGTPEMINKTYKSLKSNNDLDSLLSSEHVFIVDKDLSQRGRIDDRKPSDIDKGIEVFGLSSYNSTKVSQIKNKMNDDLRILFTEYRQKRKGGVDSNNRRNENIESDE
jgi:hypothetical protein